MNTLTRWMNPMRMTALAASLALAGVATAQADPDYWAGSRWAGTESHDVVDGNLVDVQVRVDGAAAPLFFKPGAFDRHYFQAFKGRNYSIVVRNTTGRRVGVLIAVDGLNVVNGQRSSLDRHESMYVLDPWEQAEIKGWRTSLRDVRRFVFVDEERSYAERTGQANGDMGWIRVLAFREVEPRAWWDGWRSRRTLRDENGNDSRGDEREQGAAPPQAQAPMGKALPESKSQARSDRSMAPEADNYAPREQESSPGTGWGDRRWDPVQQTAFEAEHWASDRITLRYEYTNGLRALGISPRRPRIWERERGELGFAQPPRW